MGEGGQGGLHCANQVQAELVIAHRRSLLVLHQAMHAPVQATRLALICKAVPLAAQVMFLFTVSSNVS